MKHILKYAIHCKHKQYIVYIEVKAEWICSCDVTDMVLTFGLLVAVRIIGLTSRSRLRQRPDKVKMAVYDAVTCFIKSV